MNNSFSAVRGIRYPLGINEAVLGLVCFAATTSIPISNYDLTDLFLFTFFLITEKNYKSYISLKKSSQFRINSLLDISFN